MKGKGQTRCAATRLLRIAAGPCKIQVLEALGQRSLTAAEVEAELKDSWQTGTEIPVVLNRLARLGLVRREKVRLGVRGASYRVNERHPAVRLARLALALAAKDQEVPCHEQ